MTKLYKIGDIIQFRGGWSGKWKITEIHEDYMWVVLYNVGHPSDGKHGNKIHKNEYAGIEVYEPVK